MINHVINYDTKSREGGAGKQKYVIRKEIIEQGMEGGGKGTAGEEE